jgi:outer membrane cobalamin receptor
MGVVCPNFAANVAETTVISGKIYTEGGAPVEFATILLKNTSHGCTSDAQGFYRMNIPAGSYTLMVSAVGFETVEQSLVVRQGESLKRNFKLHEATYAIDEVVVKGGGVSRINNSAFNAVAVDATKLDNATKNITDVLNTIPGMAIREDGGVGSAATINLNGFTGKHVKIFMDGVPMEGNGSAFQINNIPATLAERVEVYKGVVPVDFGGDALGGAINIVTRKRHGYYGDLSYSYGSFNTHRSNLNLGYTGKRGWAFRLSAHQNYSDNDYKVLVENTDLQTGAISKEEEWHRRFHDRYHNEAVTVETGVTGKAWADRLMVGVTYSHDYAQIQNANLMKIVFGGKARETSAWAPTLQYEKKNLLTDGLNFSLSARYNVVTTNNTDTVARKYNWAGAWIPTVTQGEGVATLAEYRGKTAYLVANLRYHIGKRHFFTLNDMFSDYRRHTTDNAANSVQQTAATFMRRINQKNVLGFSYKYLHDNRWNTTAFVKYYQSTVKGPVNISNTTGNAQYEEQQRSVDVVGYGAAGTYYLSAAWQGKLSLEKSYRMPTDLELFGDGDYENGDASLRPENSLNINLNFTFDKTVASAHNFTADLGLFYRNVNDYIIRSIGSKGTAVSTNHGNVLGLGGDIDLRYSYKRALTVGVSGSYQDMRDKEHYTALGARSVTYNNRVPNLPYLFGGADASYRFYDLLGKGSSLTVGYDLRYTNKFYRSWVGEGARLYIPQQVAHNAQLSASFCHETYNITFELKNFTNERLYDNYSLQKPGRNMNVKLRYRFASGK